MNLHVKDASRNYSLEIQRLPHRVTAYRGDQVLASSTDARAMFETRVPTTIYFPPQDVMVPLDAFTDLQTFCPFKGTASYRDVVIGEDRIANGMWSYENALPESDDIEGYVGFMPDAVTRIDLGENTLQDKSYGNISGPVVDWLLREAAYLPSPEAFTEALVGKLQEHGVAISRCSVMIWSLHPLIVGKNYVWEKTADQVSTYAPSYELHNHPAFVNSPLRHVSNGLGGVRQRLTDSDATNSFPILDDLRAKGATDYVAMPLPFSDGRTNVLTLASDHPDGFTTANLGLVFECSAVISRYYEVFMQRENAQTLLETYVGKRTGARVLGGEIRRGDGDQIDAAIMFCDLRGSTRLEEALGRDAYITLLNDFFETTSTIVHEHGGEVLKFIGDAVLAIFPAGEDAKAASAQALSSACAVLDTLKQAGKGADYDCAIGIAFGEVTYGNVGSRERLDFTVIGQAANVAARLCDYGKTLGHGIVVTQDIEAGEVEMLPLGAVRLHNVSTPVEAFAVASCAAQQQG